MSDYLDKSRLTSQTLPEDDVTLAEGKVRVRGLSRGEVFAMHEAKKSGGLKTEGEWERRMVSIALVAPEMTEDEVGAWQRTGTAGGDLEKVTSKISELSGLSEGADKSGVPDVRDEPGD
jgi:hypothetical protein